MRDRQAYLNQKIEHIDIKRHNVVSLVEDMQYLANSARDLSRAARIFDRMVCDNDCTIFLCLAGSLVSAGLKGVFTDLIRSNMVDAIVSTGANIVDQDFFEALGFHHYVADDRLRLGLDDQELRRLHLDRIYDTLIDEDELRVCDETIREIADALEPGMYSSREFIRAMGEYLQTTGRDSADSIVLEAFRRDVPIFCPAFSDCSAGFGLVAHQAARKDKPKVGIDSVRDFLEITECKIKSRETGLLMLGGGVPKNFAQDIVVAAEILEGDCPMHKYAIQVTVADVRDGGLSGSTLREACSWGKVDTAYEQMVYSEATLAVPLVAGYAYHKGNWRQRHARRLAQMLTPAGAAAPAE
jgi:deoxyhypusine synthase